MYVCVQTCVCGGAPPSSLPNWGQIQLFAKTTWKSLCIVPAGAPNLAAIALAALKGPFILEGNKCLRPCMCICMWWGGEGGKASSFILQGNEQGNEDAPGGDQIITHLGSETDRDFTNAARTHTHIQTQVQCINVTKWDKSHFHLRTEGHRSSTNTCIYSKRRGKKKWGGESFQQGSWLLVAKQSFSISLATFKWILRLRHVPLQVAYKSLNTSCSTHRKQSLMERN